MPQIIKYTVYIEEESVLREAIDFWNALCRKELEIRKGDLICKDFAILAFPRIVSVLLLLPQRDVDMEEDEVVVEVLEEEDEAVEEHEDLEEDVRAIYLRLVADLLGEKNLHKSSVSP